jgi:molybdopterin-guanine dinucleotide biosynthesis protein A
MEGQRDDSVAIVLLAGGRGSRFGGLKQRAPVGPAGEPLAAYALHDAARAGVDRAVVVCPPGLGLRLGDELAAFAPAGLTLRAVEQERPGQRHGPWGTAHALLAAAPALGRSPFLVANADDFYGRAAIAAAASHLGSGAPDRHAVVAYRLDRTMAHTDGVSRGRCLCEGGRLVRVQERVGVRALPDGRYLGRTPAGAEDILEPDAPVSMNLWAFGAALHAGLRRAWSDFLEAGPAESEEFMIPDAVNRAIEGGARVRVVRTEASAFGITTPADLPRARAALARLVAEGAYSADLRAGAQEAG